MIAPNGDYEIEAEFTSATESSNLGLHLPLRETTAMFVVGSRDQTGQLRGSGFEYIDGKPVYENESSTQPGVLAAKVRHRLKVRVTLTDDGVTLIGAINDKEVSRWSGPRKRLSPQGWNLAHPHSLGLAVTKSAVTFHRYRLRMLTGEAKSIEQVRNYAALYFEGDDSVLIPTLKIGSPEAFTMEAFVKIDNVIQRSAIISNTEGAGIALKIQNDRWRTDGYSYSGKFEIDSIDRVTLGQWSHVAVVIGQKQVKLFVDGKLQGTAPLGALSPSKSPFAIGANPNSLGESFTEYLAGGQIRGVRFSEGANYTGAFTPPTHLTADADTLALYYFDEGEGEVLGDESGHGHDAKINGATWMPKPNLAHGLVGHWTFDEGEGEIVRDSSGVGNNGRLMYMDVSKAWRRDGPSGIADNAGCIQFHGNKGHVQVDQVGNSLDLTDAVSLAAWVKLRSDQVVGSARIVDRYPGYSLTMAQDGHIDFYTSIGGVGSVGSVAGSRRSIADDQWHHVVGVFDGEKLTIYVNGKFEAERKSNGLIAKGASDFAIGGRSLHDSFVGAIDDVRIYNRPLTRAEINLLSRGAVK